MTTQGSADTGVDDPTPNRPALGLRAAVMAVEDLDEDLGDAVTALASARRILDALRGRTIGLVLSHDDAAAMTERLDDARAAIDAIRADRAHTLALYDV